MDGKKDGIERERMEEWNREGRKGEEKMREAEGNKKGKELRKEVKGVLLRE